LNKKLVAFYVVVLFMLITGLGMLSGFWHNKITKEEYIGLHKNIDGFGHPTSVESTKRFNQEVNNSTYKDR
jgi:hypothetical protein